MLLYVDKSINKERVKESKLFIEIGYMCVPIC